MSQPSREPTGETWVAFINAFDPEGKRRDVREAWAATCAALDVSETVDATSREHIQRALAYGPISLHDYIQPTRASDDFREILALVARMERADHLADDIQELKALVREKVDKWT